MIKKIVCLIMIMVLVGCQSTAKSDNLINIDVFVLDTCSNCQAFKEYGIPALEKEFADKVKITLYNLDEIEHENYYNEVIKKLDGFNEAYSKRVPFIVVQDYFAVLAYNRGEEVYLINDIKSAINGDNLGEELALGRWIFKGE